MHMRVCQSIFQDAQFASYNSLGILKIGDCFLRLRRLILDASFISLIIPPPPPPGRHASYFYRLGPANLVVPFVACGDLSGFDADKSYPLEMDDRGEEEDGRRAAEGGYRRIPPAQMPIRPPHETFRMRKTAGGQSLN